MGSEDETAKKIKELRARAWSVWVDAKKLVNSTGRDDRLFFQHTIKSQCINLVDSLQEIGRELRGINDGE